MKSINKRKLLTNVLVDLLFAILFLVIYQISILNNLDVFGETTTGGGLFPQGVEVDWIFFNFAIVSIIIAVVLWRIKKLNIKMIPLLLIAVILPIMVYSINHRIFINGSGADYKEKQTVVIKLKDHERYFKNYTDEHTETLKKYPIFVSEQDNDDFYTYLYVNEALDDMYLFMKLSPDSKSSGCGYLVCYQFMQPLEEYLAENKELNYDERKVISINDYGIRDVEIYNNCAILTKEDSTKAYFICDDFKWLLDN